MLGLASAALLLGPYEHPCCHAAFVKEMVPTLRPTARVLLVDEDERVLLFRGESDADGSGFWFATGGGIEPGETSQQAAVREVLEETGQRIELGPEVWTRRHVVTWGGRTFDVRERWFLTRVRAFDIDTSGFSEEEQRMVTRHAWWSLDELDAASERLVPSDLATRLRDLLRFGPPPVPVAVGV
jgi:8-oxo-dGTP pyrophosphatase MutT (NUDIX family)